MALHCGVADPSPYIRHIRLTLHHRKYAATIDLERPRNPSVGYLVGGRFQSADGDDAEAFAVGIAVRICGRAWRVRLGWRCRREG